MGTSKKYKRAKNDIKCNNIHPYKHFYQPKTIKKTFSETSIGTKAYLEYPKLSAESKVYLEYHL